MFEKNPRHVIFKGYLFLFCFTMSASETGPILLTMMSTSTKVGGPVDQNNFISIKVFISFDHFFLISLFRDLLHQALSDGCNCRAVCRAIEKRYGEF